MMSEFSAAASFLALAVIFASVSHTWELDAASFWFESPAADFPALCAVRFEPCWLVALSISGRFDALELVAVGEVAAEHETKFNVGLDFATALSSHVPHCILFDIASEQLAELKMQIMNRWRRLFCSSRVKLSFVKLSTSWFLVPTDLIWIFWGPGWFCTIANQAQLCGFGMRVSLLDFCPWWSFWSLLHYLQKLWSIAPNWEDFTFEETQSTLHNSRSLCWIGVLTWFLRRFLVSLHILFGFLRLKGRRMQHFSNPNPQDQEREFHPCVDVHQEKQSQIPSNCAKQKFVSCTSKWLEQTCDFQICTKFPLRPTLSL